MRAFLVVLLLIPESVLLQAQTLLPRAVVPTGGNSGTSFSWTLGQVASATYSANDRALTAGVQQPEGVLLSLNISALLDGPYDPATDLMYDSLRTRGMLPASEPFSALGHPPVGMQSDGQLGAGALLGSGPDAVVDWVFLELRSAADPADIEAARTAVVQRDGDVVDVDGLAPVRITALPGAYYLALRHRNHLPVMTAAPIILNSGSNILDLTDGSIALHVPDAERFRDGRWLLWQGDVTGNGTVKYTGSGNDRDPILIAVGGTTPNNVAHGYLPTDVNLDGSVKYTGTRNDRDPVLITIGAITPNAVRSQPLP